MGALTKAELDQVAAEWREDCAARGHPGATKSVPNAALVKAIISAVAPVIFELEKQIVALQVRVDELESSALKYCGVYQPSASYQRGNFVTYDGSAFHATRVVSGERPGTTNGWQLMIKHGKDASAPTTARARENGHYSKPRSP